MHPGFGTAKLIIFERILMQTNHLVCLIFWVQPEIEFWGSRMDAWGFCFSSSKFGQYDVECGQLQISWAPGSFLLGKSYARNCCHTKRACLSWMLPFLLDRSLESNSMPNNSKRDIFPDISKNQKSVLNNSREIFTKYIFLFLVGCSVVSVKIFCRLNYLMPSQCLD